MVFQTSRIDHDRLLVSSLGSKAGHDTGEHTHPAPPLVERLWRAIIPGHVTPTQVIEIDVVYATQDAPVINPGAAMAFGEEGLKPRLLWAGPQEKIAHQGASCALLNHRTKP